MPLTTGIYLIERDWAPHYAGAAFARVAVILRASRPEGLEQKSERCPACVVAPALEAQRDRQMRK
jgi:hypothetical protein